MGKRDLRLDVLRGIAVLMVLVHHSPTSLGSRLRAGWSGVDLFFVLSGFLVSGLLFKEHLRSSAIDPWRFYVRRGFKIYPNFYVMLTLTTAMQAAAGVPPRVAELGHEALFVQNYLPRVWPHTWSLAVEEHFYLLLAPALALLLRWRKVRTAPVTTATIVMALIGGGSLLLRCLAVYGEGAVGGARVMFWTHTRLDSLAFGVWLSALWHFKPHLVGRVHGLRTPLLAGGLACVLPAFLLPYDHPFMLTFGLTLLYLGYGAVLAAVLASPDTRPAGRLARLLAGVGLYSYSIYLWHHPVWSGLRWLGWPLSPGGVYFPAALLVGIVTARLVELPALALRDRWFPNRSAAPTAPPSLSAPSTTAPS